MGRFLGVIVLVALVVAGLRVWTTGIYAITPGNATNVAPLVAVKGLGTDPRPDRIMLVDVFVQPLSELEYLYMKYFERPVEFVSAGELVGPNTPAAELTAQGFLQMSDSQMAAKVAALRALGWRLPATARGAVVTSVFADTPALRAGLKVGDEITAVNGRPVSTQCALIGALAHVPIATRLVVTLRRARFSAAGVLTRAAATRVALTTAASPDPLALTGCANAPRSGPSILGVAGEDGVGYALPGAITLRTANIGGPSAGLAMTLTLIDTLSRGSLTGHHPIATTGTIDPAGRIGPIGGAAEKTVAVERAGIHYFFVPAGADYAAARAEANSSLHVYSVSTLSQVLADLRALGGGRPVPYSAPH